MVDNFGARPTGPIWVTKGCLTQGIRYFENARHCTAPGLISLPVTPTECVVACDWHRSEAEATERAEEMRARGISHLEKQIEKLKGLQFPHVVK